MQKMQALTVAGVAVATNPFRLLLYGPLILNREDIAMSISDVILSVPGRASSRKSLLVRFVEALHQSRRRDTARVLHRHRHLIDEVSRSKAARALQRYALSTAGRDVDRH
jgi:hypothetical protein